MKVRGLAVGVVVALAVTLPAVPAGAERPSTDQTSVIVVLEPGGDVAGRAAHLATEHRGQAPRIFEHALGGFQFVGPATAAARLERAPGVRAVVDDEKFELVDVAGFGFFRIDAEHSVNHADGPYRGANTRLAVIDSGIDTDHRDLAPNLDLANGYNCVNPGSAPEDDNGHGTHVAGIAAAAFNSDGYGLVGVAPEASIVPLKAFAADGSGSTAWILCAFDRLAQVVAASPMPTALNMSFAAPGTDSACDDADATDVLHEALCDVVEAGDDANAPVVPIAAAGNDDANAASTIPAAYHDVITVSALADHDGEPGGKKGCVYVQTLFNYECDDTIASFSNYGTVVDVMAPGVDIYSTVPDGHGYLSGTSMAAPHVAGVVSLVLGEHAALDTAGVRSLLQRTGECPNGTTAGTDASCAGQGSWRKTANRSFFDETGTEADPDGIAEPFLNAVRAAVEADIAGDPPAPPPADAPPAIAIVTPDAGATVSGVITVSGTASDDEGAATVTVAIDGGTPQAVPVAGDGTWSHSWDTTSVTDGVHTITATATDTASQTTSELRSVTVDNAPAQSTMRIGELSGSASSGKKWTATVEMRVVDATGSGVEGATVTVTFDATTASTAAKGGTPGPGGGGGGGGGGGTQTGTLSCVTGSDGRCSVSTKPSSDSVRFTITGVTKDSWTYDSSGDVDADTATPETDIVVSRL